VPKAVVLVGLLSVDYQAVPAGVTRSLGQILGQTVATRRLPDCWGLQIYDHLIVGAEEGTLWRKRAGMLRG